MAPSLQHLLIVAFISTTAAAAATASTASTPSLPPSQYLDHHAYPPFLFSSILSTLGFQELSTATASLSSNSPTTIFAPTDSSLISCPSCSLPLLLQEHSVPGLYPLQFLRTLAFGTKIETLAPNRCLTITSTTTNTSTATAKVFVNGIEISHPDLFNNGLVIVHGLQGFVSHLSPLSCSIERMTSLSFSPLPQTASFFIMRLMLKDAMFRLRISGFDVLSLALRVKYTDLVELRSMTVFALDDASIIGGGHEYISDLKFHIVPNKLLTADDLISLPVATELRTMEPGQKLVVTTAGGGGPLVPIRINYVKIKSLDLLHNLRIVVHGVALPFPHIRPTADHGASAHIGLSGSDYGRNDDDVSETVAPIAGITSTVEIEDQPGLEF